MADAQAPLNKARLEYEAFQASLYVAHPELKVQRGETQPFTPDEATSMLPDDQTAILEYVVTEDKSYLFVIRKSAGIAVHALNVKGTELAQMAESFRQKVAERDLTIKQPAQRLYDLLSKPAEAQLRGVRKLRIVPDGALWNVPFQALHQNERGYLLEQYAVAYAPSLSVLREMRRRANTLAANHAQPMLLAMGNPALNGDTEVRVRVTRRDEPLGPDRKSTRLNS